MLNQKHHHSAEGSTTETPGRERICIDTNPRTQPGINVDHLLWIEPAVLEGGREEGGREVT